MAGTEIGLRHTVVLYRGNNYFYFRSDKEPHMDSSLGWLDTTHEQREEALDLIDSFQRRDTRDELGIGRIRDAFSNLLFPGTSTIQTRARYFLFVPWIYQDVENKDATADNIREDVQSREIRLIRALRNSDDTEGVIGKDAGSDLQRMPSSIYWRGLQTWGILRYNGSRSQYHSHLQRQQTVDLRRGLTADRSPDGSRWHGGLPDPPDGFPKEASISLPPHEAEYLQETIVDSNPNSLLAELALLEPTSLDADFPWKMAYIDELQDRHRHQLHHARNFSEVMHGAAYLYNLLLAEKSGRKDLEDEFCAKLVEWADSLTTRWADIETWSLTECWELVEEKNENVPFETYQFVEQWVDIVRDDPNEIWADNDARKLIRTRELKLKKNRARLHNPEARRLWNGEAGLSQLEYRWDIAKTHLRDIFRGKEGA